MFIFFPRSARSAVNYYLLFIWHASCLFVWCLSNHIRHFWSNPQTKTKPDVRQGRKATGPPEADSLVTLETRWLSFFVYESGRINMRKKVFLSVILVIQFLIATPSIVGPEFLHNNQTCCEAGADNHGAVATDPCMSYPALVMISMVTMMVNVAI